MPAMVGREWLVAAVLLLLSRELVTACVELLSNHLVNRDSLASYQEVKLVGASAGLAEESFAKATRGIALFPAPHLPPHPSPD